MYQFKRKLYHLVLNVLFSALLISCGAGFEKQKIDFNTIEGNSPFRVSQITGDSRTIYENGLPALFILDLKTCVKDSIRKDTSLQDITFLIEYNTNKSGKIVKKTAQVSTNEDGCMKWTEQYEYKYVTQPLWIGLSRSIVRKKGAYAGQVFVRTAVNPWLREGSRNPSVMDLRPSYYDENNDLLKGYTYKKEGLSFLTSDKLEYPQLWASRIDVQIDLDDVDQDADKGLSTDQLIQKYKTICNSESQTQCFSRNLSMRLTIPLELRILDLEKQLQDSSINGGVYKIKAQLVSQYPSGRSYYYRIHEKILEINSLSMGNERQANQSTKFLNANFKLKIPYINKNANNKIVIEVEARDLPFKKFQGVYTLRDIELGVVKKFNIDSVLDEKYKVILDEKHKNDRSKVVRIIEDMNIKYIYDVAKNEFEKNISSRAGKTSDTERYDLIETQMRKIGFNPAHLDATIDTVRFSNVKNNANCATNEVVVRKTVQYVGKVCFKDFLKNNYEQTTFRIFRQDLDSDGESQGKLTELFRNDKNKTHYSADARGCITFSDEIEHKNYDRQIYYPREMHFFSEVLNLYGKIRVAINPWQEAFQFFQDITQLGRDKIRTGPEGVNRPRLVINQFRGVNFFPTYIVDKLLNLHLFQNLYVLFQPIITRHDSVSRGKHSRAREYIRDGYYLLRLLVTRSPHETEEHPRIISDKENNESRKEIYNDKLTPQFKDGHYITHVDTVIKAQANYTNMYVPVQFNKEQLYYVGSRNRIILQMVPADPKYYKYKNLKDTEGVCEIDLEKTKWKPYVDHDLVTYPHAGPYTPQDWVNWNILRPAPHLKTDEIVMQSKEGRERQLFNMDPVTCNFNSSKKCQEDKLKINNKSEMQSNNEVSDKNKKIIISEGLPGSCSEEELKNIDMENAGSVARCFPEGTADRIPEQMKDYLENKMNQNIDDKSKKTQVKSNSLEDFAFENALVVVDLADPNQRDEFVKDMNESSKSASRFSKNIMDYKRLDGIPSNSIDYRNNGYGHHSANVINNHLLSRISSSEIKRYLSEDLRNNCIIPHREALHSNSDIYEYQDCAISRVRAYLADHINNQSETYFDNMKDFIENSEVLEATSKIYYPATGMQNVMVKMSNLVIRDSNENTIEKIVNVGVQSENAVLPTMGSFVHSLCQFWIDKYMKKYLKARQMRAAHANYVRKNDYHVVLDSYLKKGRNIGEYFKAIHNHWSPEEGGVKKCHDQYTQCILSDYCRERGHATLDSQCESFSNSIHQEQSCQIILNKKCESHPNSHLCTSLDISQINSKKCNTELNLYCNSNPKDPICYDYKNRCLVNYYDCTGNHTDYFDSLIAESPFNIPSLDSFRGRFQTKNPLKTCLADPYKFFEFENKVIVEDINNKHEVIGGYASNFSVSSSLSIGSYLNWTSQRSVGAGVKTAGSAGLPNLLGLGFGVSSDMSMSVSSNESNSSRRARDVRLSEGVYLTASKLSIKMGVTQYRKCLVVKPRVNAFTSYNKDGLLEPYSEKKVWKSQFHGRDFKKVAVTRSGLMICNPSVKDEKKPLNILEDYYYVTQGVMNPNNSEFLNLYDIINRPFVIALRGRREFVKMLYLLQNVMEGNNKDLNDNADINSAPKNQFIHYSHPVEEVVGLKLSMREFNETGFHNGVYTYPRDIEDLDVQIVKKKSNGIFKKVFDAARNNNLFSVPTYPQNRIPVQEE